MSVQFRQLLILILLLPLSWWCTVSFAQKNSPGGMIVDTAEKKNLHFAITTLIDLTDTTQYVF